MSELPKGWVETTLGELVAFNPKLTLDDDTDIGFVPMSHAPTNFRDKLNYETRSWGEVRKAYTHFANGDVIFAKVTPCFENGKAAVVSGLPNASGAGSSEFHVLRPVVPEISPTYLLAVIKSAEFLREGEAAMTGAVGLRRVPRSFVETFPVRLPPVAEQARIAQALDALLAQVDTLKARLDALPALIKRFRQSVLNNGTAGNIDLFFTPDRKNIKTLKYKIADILYGDKDGICRGPFGSAIKKEFFVNFGFKVYEQKNAIQNDALIGNYYINREKFDELFRFSVNPGDFIVSCAGTLGKISIIPPDSQPGIINQALIRIRTDKNKIHDKFFLHLFRSPDFQEKLTRGARGGAMQNLASTKEIKEIEIDLPSPDDQKLLVERIDLLLAFADQLEARLADARARVDALTQSILAKAFRGELVPQNPADEPASVLLERIKAQRAAAPKPKRGRKSV